MWVRRTKAVPAFFCAKEKRNGPPRKGPPAAHIKRRNA